MSDDSRLTASSMMSSFDWMLRPPRRRNFLTGGAAAAASALSRSLSVTGVCWSVTVTQAPERQVYRATEGA